MEQRAFQLYEYRIVENANGLIWWEAHFGLGKQRSGSCLIHGDILVMGRFTHEENGFLKREFLDRLKSLPFWNRTTYYCMASQVFHVSSGQHQRLCRSGHIPWKIRQNRSCRQSLESEAQETYRLDRYALAASGGMQISWQAWEGFDSIVGGRCGIKSGILFIGPKEYAKAGQDKREFLHDLRKLPQWNKTKLWAHSASLRSCETEPTCRSGFSVDTRTQRNSIKEVFKMFTRRQRVLLFALSLIVLNIGTSNLSPTAWSDDTGGAHRKRHRERHRERYNEAAGTSLKAVSDSTYKQTCGGCHFAYQPELLPRPSWDNIVNRTDDHFGESLELDEQTKNSILGYLRENAADHSTSKVARKILRSCRDQTPGRITEVPYIRDKHHEIPAATIEREAIRTLANCTACHSKAEEGIFDDDFVVIPK